MATMPGGRKLRHRRSLIIVVSVSFVFGVLSGVWNGAASSAPAEPAEPLVLTPGVTDVDATPETWKLDLRDMTPDEAREAASGLSSRLYGIQRGQRLHTQLQLRSAYQNETVLGVHVEAVSVAGGTLDVAVDGRFYARRSWPPADDTHTPETTFYLPVPAGDHTVSFRTNDDNGVVRVTDYTYAESPDQFPSGRPTERLERQDPPSDAHNSKGDGYKGIWFQLGADNPPYGPKYSGGLGTYTMKHSPLAVYAPEVDKTFFTYGGTTGPGDTHLQIMASEYDHPSGTLPRPTMVHDKLGVNDPHDNASIALDDDGYVWIFVSGRGTARPGLKYRSLRPYSVAAFEHVRTEEMTYPQPRYVSGQGFVNLFTKYTAGRELYVETSPDGETWTEDRKLANGGHYQVTEANDGTIVTAFDWHIDGDVDTRTNLYVLASTDFGQTWTTMDGTEVDLPLDFPENSAMVRDYQAEGRLVYVKDLGFDADGNPVVLYVTSDGAEAGPDNDPRTWEVARWDGDEWVFSSITNSDHNYDSGSLYIAGDSWTVVAPTEVGPQAYHTGGELAIWRSTDQGATWEKAHQVTSDSEFNHTYARRPLDAADPFYAMWADGDPRQVSAPPGSASRLYFGSSAGEHWQLPYEMSGDTATPIPMSSG